MYMIYIHFNSCKTFLFFINSIWRLLVKFVFYFLRWSFLFCPMDLWVMEFCASPALKILNCPLQYWSITFQCIVCIHKQISNTHVWKIELSASLLIIRCSRYFVKFCYSAFKNIFLLSVIISLKKVSTLQNTSREKLFSGGYQYYRHNRVNIIPCAYTLAWRIYALTIFALFFFPFNRFIFK